MGVNRRAKLVPSHRAYARNGASRRWLGDYTLIIPNYEQLQKNATIGPLAGIEFAVLRFLCSATTNVLSYRETIVEL